MRDLNDLMYFAAVVEHGGFTAASRALGVPKSKLSRRVAELETQLNVRLLQRSTRRLTVTDIGHRVYTHAKAMMLEAQAAETVVASTHAEPCGSLHVSCPIALLHMQVADMLTAFALRYPLVQLQVSALNRAVDVIAEGVDVALRVRPLPLQDSELAMRHLGESQQCLVASPALVNRLGQPDTPAALSAWPSLGLGGGATRHVWSLVNGQGDAVEQAHTPHLVTTDMVLLMRAALSGIGVVQLPHALVNSALSDGRLVQVLADWRPPARNIHAVFASRRGLTSSVRALLDFLAHGFAAAETGAAKATPHVPGTVPD